jgi:hypothetical protein
MNWWNDEAAAGDQLKQLAGPASLAYAHIPRYTQYVSAEGNPAMACTLSWLRLWALIHTAVSSPVLCSIKTAFIYAGSDSNVILVTGCICMVCMPRGQEGHPLPSSCRKSMHTFRHVPILLKYFVVSCDKPLAYAIIGAALWAHDQ